MLFPLILIHFHLNKINEYGIKYLLNFKYIFKWIIKQKTEINWIKQN